MCVIWTFQCSATCGEAVQVREVVCSENSDCDPDQKPPTLQPCLLPKCLAWKHGPWNTVSILSVFVGEKYSWFISPTWYNVCVLQCSKTCGEGQQIRAVQCINITSETLASDCDLSAKPAEIQTCNPDPCPSGHSGSYLHCSSNVSLNNK